MPEQPGQLSPLQQALVALKELRARLDAAMRARHAPIAIVGIGCRFPGGANGPDAFWQLLRDGVDAISDIPSERWDADAFYDSDPAAPGKMATRWGGFLRDVDQFDAAFFGLSRRETVSMDPQQRLLLEVAWEALEHAGIPADRLLDSPTGVFVGMCNTDYAQLVGQSTRNEPYVATGNTMSVAAGRLSYVLGLQGPSLAIDTSCSSSLVAIHLACQSLRAGECNLALAGGVNLVLSPLASIALSQLQIMSPDGRCKSFDAGANGIVRGEGCGLVVLKRLTDAEADGDSVLAVIRGSAVNQDGRSAGLTAPNGPAQEAVIRAALMGSGVAPTEVGYVEAHGTGTALGDPIEIGALANVLGKDRQRNQPLLVGSVKTNIGHTEAAAGVAGVIKAVLAVQNAAVPPHLHYRTPSPYIAWDEIPVQVPAVGAPWPAHAGRRIAGVSSFGFSGTNAHVLLEAPQPTPQPPLQDDDRPFHLLTLSAKTEAALRELAARYARQLERTPVAHLGDLCYAANTGRAQLAERLALVVGSPEQAASRLGAYADGRCEPGLEVGRASATAPRLAFLFSDTGAGDPVLGRVLHKTQPTFRRAFDQCTQVLPVQAGRFALFAFQYALSELWQSWGVRPWAVLGQGDGRYAASVVAGLPLADAAQRLVAGGVPVAMESEVRGIFTLLMDEANVATGLESLFRQAGCSAFLEIGTGQTLLDRGRLVLPNPGLSWLRSLRSGYAEWPQLLECLGALWARGIPVDWAGFDRDYPRRKVTLPTYPFQRQRYWVDVPTPRWTPAADAQTAEPAAVMRSYAVRWQSTSAESSRPSEPGRWLVFADAGGIGEALTQLLTAAGSEVLLIEHNQLDPMQGQGLKFEQLWRQVSTAPGPPWRGAVYLWGVDSAPAEPRDGFQPLQNAATACGGLLRLIQILAASDGAPRVWVVTRGAQAASDGRVPLAAAQAPLWGLGRVAALEHPELWGGLIDLDPLAPEPAQLLAELGRAGRDNQVAIRAGKRLVARLAATDALADGGRAPAGRLTLTADATYLVTGGLGALGLQVARWLIERGARHLVLLGRTAPRAETKATLADLERDGAHVVLARADVADADALARAVSEATAALPPLRGVIHAAGLLDDGVLLKQTQPRFERVLAPKVAGAWNLHCLTRDRQLDFFVMFSSAAALLGSPGQASYVAANAFLDALAHHRRALGLAATSINWGPWADAGMAAQVGNGSRWEKRGMQLLNPRAALEALERILALELTQVGVMAADWPNLLVRLDTDGPPPFLADLHASSPPVAAAPIDPILDQLRAAGAEQRPGLLHAYLHRQVARVLGASEAEVSPTASLLELGVDSLMVMELLNALKRELALNLYPREVYERPTIGALARYLSDELEGVDSASTAPPVPIAVQPVSAPRAPSNVRRKLDAEIVFVLSSPRSGSTLLRVMLAGHPDLFSPPELHLLPFETMGERQAKLGASYLGEGLQRALMELHSLDGPASRSLVDDLIARDAPVADVYRLLQDAAQPRILVDKSPTYAASLAALRRAEALFDQPKYVHLARHPYAAIESFVRLRMHRLVGADEVDPWLLAEHIWSSTNANLLRFLAELDSGRSQRVLFERLVVDPMSVMTELAEFLGLAFDPVLLTPYDGQRMTDGPTHLSAAIGDPRFGEHDRIDPNLADAWRSITLPNPLGPEALRVTAELGYAPPATQADTSTHPQPTGFTMSEQFVAPRGVQLCLCTWGRNDGRPVVCVHGILDHGAAWDALARPLAARGFAVFAPDQRGHGRSAHAAPGGSYHLIDFVADLDAVLGELALGPVTLVGHSFGAVVAAALTAARPDRVGALVLVEPPLSGESRREDPAARLTVQLDCLAAPPPHPVLPDLGAAADRLRQATPALSRDEAQRAAARLTEPCPGGWRWRWDPLLGTRAGLGFDTAPDPAALLGALRSPVTLVTGTERDARQAERLASFVASLPGVRRVDLSGGHHLHLEAADLLAEVIAEAATRAPVQAG